MERTVHELRSSGFCEATLWVLGTNERARRFYTMAGWTPEGARKTEQLGSSEVVELRYRRSL